MIRTLLSATVVASMLMFSACNSNKDSKEVAENATEAAIDSSATALGGEDKDEKEDAGEFMINAANGGMLEMEASKVALKMSSNASTKSFAQMMVTDHTKADDENKALAMKKNVSLPVALAESDAQKVKDLSEKDAKDFDHAYWDLMEESHEKDMELFKKASEEVEDADVKAFAAKNLPVVQMHLEKIKATMPSFHDADKKM